MADGMAKVLPVSRTFRYRLSVPQAGVEPATFRLGGEGCYAWNMRIERDLSVVLEVFSRDPQNTMAI